MSMPSKTTDPSEIVYPESDGRPMADNTAQFRWIVTIKENLDWIYRRDPDVFVAGDLLWYPVEGNNKIRMAPDVMVVFGRPQGDRGSYRQWVEGGMAPQVVFEILSPGNRPAAMGLKLRFYKRYGVEEYYVYDPDRGEFYVWLREGESFRKVRNPRQWVSPKTALRFELVDGDLRIYGPDGRRFLTPLEIAEQRDLAERQRRDAEEARDQAKRRAEQFAARLRALGVDPESED